MFLSDLEKAFLYWPVYFVLYVKKFYRICRIYFELKMFYAQAAGAGIQSNSQHGPQ